MKTEEFKEICKSLSEDINKLLGRVDVSEDRALTDLEYKTLDEISCFLSLLSKEIIKLKSETR